VIVAFSGWVAWTDAKFIRSTIDAGASIPLTPALGPVSIDVGDFVHVVPRSFERKMLASLPPLPNQARCP